MPAGHDADRLRKIILEAFDMSLGTGLTKLGGKVVSASATSATSTISR
jgi:alanine-glyoxylate transaminase/serine-glyoxylate transaminase/serine-pyruvate transaminase